MNKNTAESRLKAAAIAREAWAVRSDQSSVQGRLRIPANLKPRWDEQDTGDRGSTWADGYQINQELGLLYAVLARLNKSPQPSFIVDADGVTVILGQRSATAPTQIEALIKLLREVVYGGNDDTLEG